MAGQATRQRSGGPPMPPGSLVRFNPRRKANLAAVAALDERIRRGEY